MFRAEISHENAAFHPEPSHEVARLLRILANRVEAFGTDHMPSNLSDINGNVCGHAQWDDNPLPFDELVSRFYQLKEMHAKARHALKLMLEGTVYADGEGMCYFEKSDTEEGAKAVAMAKQVLGFPGQIDGESKSEENKLATFIDKLMKE